MQRDIFWILISLLGTKIKSRLPSLPAIFLRKSHYDMLEDAQYFGINSSDLIQLWQNKRRIIEESWQWLQIPDRSLIIYGDPNYPPLLMHIYSAPLCLFVEGESAILSQLQLAIVGSRNCSHYGERWAKYFATAIAETGIIITSGLALGIDSICHAATLNLGKTIAILGSGLAKVYPRQHLQLSRAILHAGGAIVSEFLPHTPAFPINFPRRNRIISGLSLGVLLIEAAQRSGSLSTVQHALNQGKEVFVIPGSLDLPTMQGNFELLKQGAHLVTQLIDILDVLSVSPLNYYVKGKMLAASLQSDNTIVLIESLQCYQSLFELLKDDEVMSIDSLQQELSCSRDEILQGLLELELAGYIEAVYGGYVKR